MTYEELFQENIRLRKRIAELEEENRSLRVFSPQVLSESEPPKYGNTKTRTEEERQAEVERRICIFLELFKGREDMFAKRWQSKSSGKSGYQPVCLNDGYNSPYCNIPKRCEACSNRSLKPLEDEDIIRHLTGADELGRDVIGLYPIREDNTVFFLCADFDDKNCQHGYKDDVLAYIHVCQDWGIPAYIERSRSGNGAHVWIFFDEAIQAATARKLGFAILGEAMNRNKQTDMKSYDRFFPNQDYLPKGGFGNLVALPLQGLARRNDNSVFVDEDFKAYGKDEQWELLAGARKMTSEAVLTVIQNHSPSLELTSSSETKPWETPKPYSISFEDFDSIVHIVKANGLYIPLKSISAKVATHLKKLASFRNPVYYELLHARKPLYNTPSMISCYGMTDNYLVLPRGCEDAVIDLIQGNLTPFEIEDKTQHGRAINVSFKGTLRKDQEAALSAMLSHDNGVLAATTAFGKTVTAIGMIARRKVGTLILVHTKALMLQWKKRLEEFLEIDEPIPEPVAGKRGRKKAYSPIGTLDGASNTLHGIIDIVVYNSALTEEGVKPFVLDYGMIIADECHHCGSVGFENVLKYATARYVYGLSATPTRGDGKTPIVFFQCGPIRFTANARSQMTSQSFGRVLIPRFTPYRSTREESSPLMYFRDMIADRARNEMIVGDIVKALGEGRTPLVLTKRTEHVGTLASMLEPFCHNVIRLVGSASAKEKREAMERLESVPSDEPLVVVAIDKYVGEGFDYPRLDTLFIALPVAYPGLVQQYTGRLHRDYEGKKEVQVYDYIDIHVPMLANMYGKRLKSYAPIGYVQQESAALREAPRDIVLNSQNYMAELVADIRSARKQVILSGEILQYMKKALATAIQELGARGVECLIVVKKDSERDSEFLTSGAKIVLSESCTISAAVIDRETLWYGNIDLLGSAHHPDESVMRIDAPAVASEMVGYLLQSAINNRRFTVNN